MKKISLTTVISEEENGKIIRSINPKKRRSKRDHLYSYHVSSRELYNDDYDLQRINEQRYSRIKHIKARKDRHNADQSKSVSGEA